MDIPLKDQVLSALSALYGRSPDQELILNATKFLEGFQTTSEAWSIADSFLKDSNTELPVKFFMAQTLKRKIKNDLDELDSNSRLALRDSLLETLFNSRFGPKNVLIQLSLALASLAIQLLEWENSVQSLIQTWGQNSEMHTVLLLFLTLLPQEVNSSIIFKTVTSEQLCQQANKLLTDNGNSLLPLLVQFLQSEGSNVEIQEKVFSCLLSWLKSGDIDIMELRNSPLLSIAFDSFLHQPALSEISTDLICAFIYETREVQSSMPVIEVIVSHLKLLLEFLNKPELDEDVYQGIIRIFSEAGEAYLDLIIDHPQHFQFILEAIIFCLKVCPLRTLSTTFKFWYSFSESFCSSREPVNKELFHPAFEATIQNIISRLRFPVNDTDFNLEEMDDFRDFRHEIGDILKDSAKVLGGNRALSISLNMIKDYLSRQEAGHSLEWQELEAVLFSIRSMGSEVKTEDEQSLCGIMELFPRLPTNEKIRYTATLILSRYANWTRVHPEYIPFQLEYVTQGLHIPEVAAASALALATISEYCGKFLVPHLSDLVALFEQHSSNLAKYELLDITSAIAHAISSVGQEEYAQVLGQVTDPIISRLQICVSELSLGKPLVEETCFNIGRLTRIYDFGIIDTHDDQNHPAVLLLQKLWPLMQTLLATFASNTAISESISRFFRIAVAKLAPKKLPYQPIMTQEFFKAFDSTGLSSYIWLLSQFFVFYSSEYPSEMIELYSHLSQSFFTKASQVTTLDEIPQDVEEFSFMLTDILKSLPLEFLLNGINSTLLEFYLVVLSMEEKHTLEASLNFLVKLLNHFLIEYEKSENNARLFPVVEFFQKHSEQYLKCLIPKIITSYAFELQDDAVSLITLFSELNPNQALEHISRSFLEFPGHPFSAVNAPSVPSVALAELLDQLKEFISLNKIFGWRSFRQTLHRFIKRYQRQCENEKKE